MIMLTILYRLSCTSNSLLQVCCMGDTIIHKVDINGDRKSRVSFKTKVYVFLQVSGQRCLRYSFIRQQVYIIKFTLLRRGCTCMRHFFRNYEAEPYSRCCTIFPVPDIQVLWLLFCSVQLPVEFRLPQKGL